MSRIHARGLERQINRRKIGYNKMGRMAHLADIVAIIKKSTDNDET